MKTEERWIKETAVLTAMWPNGIPREDYLRVLDLLALWSGRRFAQATTTKPPPADNDPEWLQPMKWPPTEAEKENAGSEAFHPRADAHYMASMGRFAAAVKAGEKEEKEAALAVNENRRIWESRGKSVVMKRGKRKVKAGRGAVARAILTVLQATGHPLSRKEILVRVNASEGSISSALFALAKNEKIKKRIAESENGLRGAAIYRLTAAGRAAL